MQQPHTPHTLNGALPIVAAALGNRLGVTVTVGGRRAFTDGQVITLPAYQIDDPAYKNIAWGYLAHEAGHIRYTDFTAFAAAATCPIRRCLVNVLEDIRIEHAMIALYPGTYATLQTLDEHLFLGPDALAITPSLTPVQLLCQALTLGLSVKMLGFTRLQALADSAAEALQTQLGSELVTGLNALLATLPACNSTTEVIALVDSILQLLHYAHDCKPQPSGSTGEKPESAETQAAHVREAALQALLNATEAELPLDRAEQVQRLLNSRASSDYTEQVLLPAARAAEHDPVYGQALLPRVLLNSTGLRVALQGLVQAQREQRGGYQRRGRRIASVRLSRLSLGDTRVFVDAVLQPAPNCAWSIVVDASSSMKKKAHPSAPSRIELALEAAFALALALEGIPGVTPSVLKFPHRNGRDVVPLVRHGQRVRTQASAFVPQASGSTPLASAMGYSAAQLLAAHEARKIMLVLTDGQPDDVAAAVTMIQRCQASGICVIGVGIHYDTQHLFQHSLVIDTLSQLSVALFKLSRQLLAATH